MLSVVDNCYGYVCVFAIDSSNDPESDVSNYIKSSSKARQLNQWIRQYAVNFALKVFKGSALENNK